MTSRAPNGALRPALQDSFAFRKVVAITGERRILGGAFAISSVLVPYCMGAIAGGIASGRVPAGGEAGDPVASWINPTSVIGGVLAVAAVACLSAVYLIWDVRRAGDLEMAAYFRRRAMATAVAVAVVAAAGVLVLRADARYLSDGLTSRALPLVVLSGASGAGALCCSPATPPVAPGCPPSSRWPASCAPGGWRSGPTCCRRA